MGLGAWAAKALGFDEEKHPRDENGRFASGSGGNAGLSGFAARVRTPTMNPKDRQEMAKTVSALKTAVEQKKLQTGTPLGQQIQIGKQTVQEHKATYEADMNKLKSLTPPPAGTETSGRVKTLQSALEKLTRKPDSYKTVQDEQDITGMRVIAKNVADVRTIADKIRSQYKVISEDNYIDHPKDSGYRSQHFVVEDHGLAKEIQVRTPNQHAFAEWAHELYKPHDERQRAALERYGTELSTYAKAMSDHFWAKDNGRESTRPVAPDVVKKYFGEPK